MNAPLKFNSAFSLFLFIFYYSHLTSYILYLISYILAFNFHPVFFLFYLSSNLNPQMFPLSDFIPHIFHLSQTTISYFSHQTITSAPSSMPFALPFNPSIQSSQITRPIHRSHRTSVSSQCVLSFKRIATWEEARCVKKRTRPQARGRTQTRGGGLIYFQVYGLKANKSGRNLRIADSGFLSDSRRFRPLLSELGTHTGKI